MKKIFTLFAASLLALGASAEAVTAKFGSDNNSAKDTEVICPAFTIAGTYVASGNSKVNVYDGDKGMKMRANQTENTLILTVKENTTITGIKIGMVTNDAEQTIPVIDVKVDNTSAALSYPIATFNTSNAEGTAVIELADIAATETIGIVFDLADYTAKNKQVFIAGEVTYVEGTTGVSDIAVSEANGEAVYYNLNGVKVANPENGLYIKVQGGKASKVLVK